MKYSVTFAGIITAIALPILGTVFTEACANEIMQFGLALPGLITIYFARLAKGDVNALGVKG